MIRRSQRGRIHLSEKCWRPGEEMILRKRMAHSVKCYLDRDDKD